MDQVVVGLQIDQVVLAEQEIHLQLHHHKEIMADQVVEMQSAVAAVVVELPLLVLLVHLHLQDLVVMVVQVPHPPLLELL